MIRRLAVLAMTAALTGCGQPAAEPEPRAVEPASAPAATPETAPAAVAAETAAPPKAEPTCREERGEDGARELVDRCIAVSPATRPPCNAENSCALIQSEIDRGCELLGDQGPGFCGAH